MQEASSSDTLKRSRMEEDEASRKLSKEGDVNARDARGLTPLLQICMKPDLTAEDMQEIKRLLQEGADPNLQDGFGKSPLALVCEFSGKLPVVEDLIKFNADVSSRDAWGRTPLHWCCDRDRFEISQTLISNFANVNAITERGDSPLLWASKSENEKIAQLLLNAGCDVHIKNNRNENALSVTSNPMISALIASKIPTGNEEVSYYAASDNRNYALNGKNAQVESSSQKLKNSNPIRYSDGIQMPSLQDEKENRSLNSEGQNDSMFDFLTHDDSKNESKPFSMFVSHPHPSNSSLNQKKLKISLKKK